jgi:amino acid transporter
MSTIPAMALGTVRMAIGFLLAMATVVSVGLWWVSTFTPERWMTGRIALAALIAAAAVVGLTMAVGLRGRREQRRDAMALATVVATIAAALAFVVVWWMVAKTNQPHT